MGEWIGDLAETFSQPPLSDREAEELLRGAREIAHRVERRTTPLAAFLIGMEVAGRIARGTPRADALSEVLAAVEGLLPSEQG